MELKITDIRTDGGTQPAEQSPPTSQQPYRWFLGRNHIEAAMKDLARATSGQVNKDHVRWCVSHLFENIERYIWIKMKTPSEIRDERLNKQRAAKERRQKLIQTEQVPMRSKPAGV